MKSTTLLFFILSTAGISACTVPKESRQLKKSTQAWRESPVLLQGYLDTPFAATFLVLRENKKFEHTSSGMVKTFEAGTWSNNNDSIHLYYMGNDQQVKDTQTVIIDRKTSTLLFEKDTAITPMRMRIMLNNL